MVGAGGAGKLNFNSTHRVYVPHNSLYVTSIKCMWTNSNRQQGAVSYWMTKLEDPYDTVKNHDPLHCNSSSRCMLLLCWVCMSVQEE